VRLSARAHVLYKSVNECCACCCCCCLPNRVFCCSVFVNIYAPTRTPERKDLQTPFKKRERERGREDQRERDAANKRAKMAFCGRPVKNRERETTPAQKKNTERVLEMASFAEAPAGDVAKGTSSPSFFRSLFSCVCVCVCDTIY
jgi:hypothetical protein